MIYIFIMEGVSFSCCADDYFVLLAFIVLMKFYCRDELFYLH